MTETAPQKICSRCKTTKPTGDFYSNKSRPSGLDCFCKECRKEASRASMKTYAQTPKGAAKIKKRAKGRVYSPEQKARRNEATREWERTHSKERAVIEKRYRENHKEKIKERRALYAANNKDSIRATHRTYHQKPEIKERNRLRMLEYRKTEEYRMWNRNRQRERYVDYRKMTKEEWLFIVNAFASCCAYCGQYYPVKEFQMEHMLPRSRGGTNSPGNIVPACKACNSMKSDKTAHEFAQLLWAPEFDPEEIGWVSLLACPLPVFDESSDTSIRSKLGNYLFY